MNPIKSVDEGVDDELESPASTEDLSDFWNQSWNQDATQ